MKKLFNLLGSVSGIAFWLMVAVMAAIAVLLIFAALRLIDIPWLKGLVG